MSEQGTQNIATAATVSDKSELDKAIEAFEAKWEKRRKIVARASDNQEAFTAAVGKIFDETNPYKDWASNAAEHLGANITLAMVETDDGENRLIAIASKDVALADEIVRENLYRMYVNRITGIAGKADSVADQFATVAGCFKPRFDVEAFKLSARDMVKFLHSKGLVGITVPTLRNSLANAAYAKAQFPQMKPEQWNIVFAIMTKNAEDAAQDTSILKHWQATRDAMTDTGAELEFGEEDFAEFAKEEEEGDTTAA